MKGLADYQKTTEQIAEKHGISTVTLTVWSRRR